MSGFGPPRRATPKTAFPKPSPARQPPAKPAAKALTVSTYKPTDHPRLSKPLMPHLTGANKTTGSTLSAKLATLATGRQAKAGVGPDKLTAQTGQMTDQLVDGLPFKPRTSSPLPTAPKYKSSGTKPAATPPQAPDIENEPEEDSGVAPLPREPLQPAEVPDAFVAPRDPEFLSPPLNGGRAEPPLPEKTRAIAMFRAAIAAAARLHAGLAADARDAVAAAKASESRLDAQGRRDLEVGLALLAEGLRSSRQAFDRAANSADRQVDQRARETRLDIQKISRSAYGTLNAARASAEAVFKAHEESRTEREKSADSSIASVKQAGSAASAAIIRLNKERYQRFKTSIAPMPSAVNEGINLRLPEKAEPSAATYTNEADLEVASLTKVFDSMKTGLKDQFDLCKDEIAKIAKSSSASITSARDSAYEHLAQTVTELHASIAAARARGHASLIRQYNQSRRQLIAAHQDRARSESEASQQRALRAANNAVAAANGQARGALSLGETLARENQRPASDFARIVTNSASAMARHVSATGREQQEMARGGAAKAESAALRQSLVTSDGLSRSAQTAAEQLNVAAEQAGTALTQQIETAVVSFDEMPEPVRRAFASALPSARSGYDLQNAQAADKLALAEDTIKGAMAGESGGKEGDKTSGTGEGQAAKSPAEKPNEFIARAGKIALEPRDDQLVAELVATANREIPTKIRSKIGPIFRELEAFSTNVENVMAQLRGMTRLQGNALKEEYENEQGQNLVAHLKTELRKTFSTGTTDDLNVSAALNYLAGENVKAALAELEATVNWSNDEGRAERVQRSLTPAQLDQLNSQNPEAMTEISKDLDGTDKLVFDALNKIKPVERLKGEERKAQEAINLKALGVANAYGLKKTIDDAREKRGEGGGDLVVDRITNSRQSMGSDILSGGDAVSSAFEDATVAQKRQEDLWAATEEGFKEVVTTLPDGSRNVAAPNEGKPLSAIARYAAAPRKYRVETARDSKQSPGKRRRGRAQSSYVSEGLDSRQTQLIDDIVRYGPNSEEAAASTIEFELNRKESKPKEDRLRKALLGDDLLAAREGESDKQREERLNDVKDSSGKVIYQGDRSRVEARRKNILAKVAERQAANAATNGTSAPKFMDASQVEAALVGRVEDRFSGDPTAKAYTKSMLTSSTFEPDPEAAFDFALAHEEKNKETLIATLGRMNRTQITDAVKKWDRAKPERVPLYQQLGLYGNKSGKLDGDARNEVEQAFRGVPRNDKERALNAIFVVEQQRRDSGAVGRTLADADYQRMVARQKDILDQTGLSREDIDETGDIKLKGKDGKPITGRFEADGNLKLDKGSRDEFEAALQFSHMHAETYKQAVDRIATGVVMGLMVLAAVITTFVTFGGAAAIWGPILITAGAGLIGMGMTAAIRGDRYTKAEIQRDLVMTFVQAATAGLGAWAGAGARGAGTAAKGAQAAVKGAATGEKLAAQVAATAGKQGLSRGAKALEFGKDVFVGGTTNAINSSVGAAMDPENRRLGKSGEKAWDSAINNFAGGALGAALTKPFAALGKPFGAGSQRVLGNVGSGFTSRLTEARMNHVAGEAHQSWGESLEIAKEGIAQDAIQAVGEHGADRAAHFRAARKLQRQRAAERAQAGKDNAVARPNAHAPIRDRPSPPLEAAVADAPIMATDTPDAPVRAAVVRDALPPELKPAVDAAVTPEVKAEPPPVAEPVVTPQSEVGSAPVATAVHDNAPAAETSKPKAPAEALDTIPVTGPEPVNDNGRETTMSARSLEKVPLGALTPANDNGNNARPAEPIYAKVALQKSGALDGGAIPQHSVFVHPDAGDLMAANDNFGSLILKDPTREVAHIYNLDTGESIVIQGNERSVGTIAADGQQTGKNVPLVYGWTRLMNGKSGGRWVMRSHFHPNKPGSAETGFTNRMPSGVKGDFKVLLNEMIAFGLTKRSSRIYYIDNGRFKYTDFGIDATSLDGRYWFEYPDPKTGVRIREKFPTLRDYHTYAGFILGERYDMPIWFTEPDFGAITTHFGADGSGGGGDAAHMITKPGNRSEQGSITPQPHVAPKDDNKAPAESETIVPGLKEVSGKAGTGKTLDPAVIAPGAPHSDGSLAQPSARPATDRPAGAPLRTPTKSVEPQHVHSVHEKLQAGEVSAAHVMLDAMGLIGEPDSMIKLRQVINDKNVDVPVRKAVAEAVLEATRQRLTDRGELKPGEPLYLVFHGAPIERTMSLKATGIDKTKLSRGPHEDFSGGLYTTRQLENALFYANRYAGREGEAFPFLIKGSDLKRVVDVSPSGPHRSLWERFSMANIKEYAEFKIIGKYEIDPQTRAVKFGTMDAAAKRGIVFDMFLASLGGLLSQPDFVFGELGGILTSGHGVGDQQTIKSPELADILNRQLGIQAPKPAVAPEPSSEPAPTPSSAEDDDGMAHMIIPSSKSSAPTSEAPASKTGSGRNADDASATDRALVSPSPVTHASRAKSPGNSKGAKGSRPKRSKAVPLTSQPVVTSVSPPSGGGATPEAPDMSKPAPSGRNRNRDQGKRVLDVDAAQGRARDHDRQKVNELLLKSQIADARSMVNRRAKGDSVAAEPAPEPTPEAAAIMKHLQREIDQQASRKRRPVTQEDRLEALEAFLASESGALDPATRRRLEWVRHNLESTTAVERAENLVKTAEEKIADADIKTKSAENAKREANRPVKALMRKTGPNYRRIKKTAKHDAILGEARFAAQQKAALAAPGGKPIGLSPDHLVPLDEISNMPQLLPIFDIHARAGPALKAEIVQRLRDLGDLPDNLIPMRSDANSVMKKHYSWHDIDPAAAAAYGYSPDDVRIMREREDKMRTEILKHIDAMTKSFKEKLAAEIEERNRALRKPADPAE